MKHRRHTDSLADLSQALTGMFIGQVWDEKAGFGAGNG